MAEELLPLLSFVFRENGNVASIFLPAEQQTSMNFITKAIIAILFAFICNIVLTALINHMKSVLRSFKTEIDQTVIIGILSAPQNFEHRLSIRKTWLKLTSYVPSRYYFLIGKEHCDVHPLDRLTPYSCIENNVSIPKGADSETTFTTVTKGSNSEKSHEPANGFGFYVIYDIKIIELGVTSKLLQKATSPVRVKLLSSFDKSILSSVTFDPDESTKSPGLIYKKVKPIILPKQYEAIVVLEFAEDNEVVANCNDWAWNVESGVINITQIIKKVKERPRPFKLDTCSHVFMKYNIPETDKLKKFLDLKEARKKEQKKFNKELAEQLRTESIKYNDLMFLDVMDVYENLPEKMIQFYLRILENHYFNYVLKTDDDSFIDLLRIHSQLKLENNLPHKGMWWWSNFKEFWAVPNSGKWKDDKYRSISYPPFPCGGGYVINKEVVSYIAKNFNYLERFQGEDISTGIWLAGLAVRRPEKFSGQYFVQQFIWNKFKGKNYKFLMTKQCQKFKIAFDECSWSCDNRKRNDLPLCNKVQLSVGEMYETWEDFITNGYL